LKRNMPTPRPAHAPFKRTLTLALLLGPLAMVSLARAGALIDIEIAPPEPRVVEVPPPRVGYVWAPGYWAYRGHHHVWVDGHWMRERPGYHWVPDHWVPHEGRYRYEQGRWER
jgi:WXXGXW repeat (2 copies)